MVLCLSVRLARNAQCVVSDFCEIDSSDQFWIDPSDPSQMADSTDEEDSLSFVDAIESRRVIWFRSRRITLLAGSL